MTAPTGDGPGMASEQRGLLLAAAAAGLAMTLLSACSGAPSGGGPSTPRNVITITKAVCGTGWRHPKSGLQTLQIRNATSSALEVTLVDADDGAVDAKLEGVGPGTTRAMPVNLGSGVYAFDCDGNDVDYATQVGPSVRVPGKVRGGDAVQPAGERATIAAGRQEEAYVAGGLTMLVRQCTALAAQIRAGELVAARVSWLAGHLTFERLGSAYGMFGDYDEAINGTPYGLQGGVESRLFTGFYRLEFGLWHGQSATQLADPAGELVIEVRSLETAWPGMQLQPPFALSDLALRTHEVLENAMLFQLSGQDNFGSGTNMATMAAGIEATREQLQILHPLLVGRYQNLAALYAWLDRLQRLVGAARTSRGWTPVSSLSSTQREQLDAAAGQTVEMLAEIPPMFEAKPLP